MRKLIIILFFIGCYKSNAQSNYIALPDSNSLWTITAIYSGGSNSRIVVKGDSLYGSYSYKKYYAVNDSNLSIATYTFLAIVRQDIPNKKVFAIKSGTTYERLLYNFNLTLNDSVRVTPLDYAYPGTTGYGSNGYRLKVIVKDSVLINSQYRKRLELKEYNGLGYPEYWIEGVGSTLGILSSGGSGYLSADACIPFLLCQKYNGVLNYLNTTYNTCIPQICTGAGINEFKNKNEGLKFYPNPTNGIINIEVENANKIKVVNVLGELVKHEDLKFKQQSIDISSLQNGIYFLQVFNKDKLIGTAKIVKE